MKRRKKKMNTVYEMSFGMSWKLKKKLKQDKKRNYKTEIKMVEKFYLLSGICITVEDAGTRCHNWIKIRIVQATSSLNIVRTRQDEGNSMEQDDLVEVDGNGTVIYIFFFFV